MKEYIRPILKAIGYYKIKSKWRWHQYISRLKQEDMRRNAHVREEIEKMDHRILPPIQKERNITVSLTTHGARLERVAPYAIYSILKQTILPNRIVLNINKEKWNEDNLPELIKKLQVAGLEVNFCEDVGPHTKLLPVLRKYPDDIIITVDDDMDYDRGMIEELMNGYHDSNKSAVVTRWAVIMIFKDGKMQPYSCWPEANGTEPDDVLLGPLGVGGVLYPPHIFTEEVFNRDIYGTLCSKADDIWFTIQEYVNKIPIYLVRNTKWSTEHSVDHISQYVAENSDALHFQNVGNGMNDVQLSNLIEYYHING